MRAICVAVAVFLGFAARADESGSPSLDHRDTPYALVGGLGHAYGLIGFHLEYRVSHWAGFLGLGLPGTFAPVAGVKWFSGRGQGFVLSLQADAIPGLHPVGEFDLIMWTTVSLTVGYRGTLEGRYFAEVGAGPAYYLYRTKVEDTAHDESHLTAHSWTGWGAMGPPHVAPVLPDFACAVGFGF